MNRQAKAPSAFTFGRSACVALLTLLALLALAPAASAGKKVDSYIGGPGTGFFSGARGVAVSSAVGHEGQIYVVEQGANRVQRFSSAGTLERAWGADVISSGPNDNGANFEICVPADGDVCKNGVASGGNAGDSLRNGALNAPSGVGIDQDSGNVYVMDRSNHRVNQYTADGIFIRSWGFDTIHASSPGDTGTDFEVCPASEQCKAAVSGTGVGQLTNTSGYMGLAVSPGDANPATGYVFVADGVRRRVQRFNLDGTSPMVIGSAEQFTSTGAEPLYVTVDASGVVYAGGGSGPNLIQRFDGASGIALPPIGIPPLIAGSVAGLKINPATNHLFVGRLGGTTTIFQEIDTGTLTVVDTHGPILNTGFTRDIDFSNDNNRYYVSTESTTLPGGSASVLFTLDDDGDQPGPVTGIELAANVTDSSAELRGSVNPNGSGFSTTYRFEFSTNGVSWTSIPGADLGNGSTPTEVSALAAGLEANTFYRARVVAIRPTTGTETVSPEITFLTDAVPPVASTHQAQTFTDSSATISGAVNPRGKPTNYYFEYGKTSAYGSKTPIGNVGSNNTTRFLVDEISGLESGRTYHYRIVAENEQGSVHGDDMTFMTRDSVGPFASRVFEQVTPVDKSEGISRLNSSEVGTAADGSGVAFRSFTPIGDANFGAAYAAHISGYISRRLADRWQTSAANPRLGSGGSGGSGKTVGGIEAAGGERLTKGLIGTGSGWHEEPGSPPGWYLRDYTTSSNTLFLDFSGVSGIGGNNRGPINFRAASADLRHIVRESGDVLTDHDPPPSNNAQVPKLYEYVDGTPRLVGIDPGGAAMPGMMTAGGTSGARAGVLSEDGRHVFFTHREFTVFLGVAPVANSAKIYRRSDGATTTLVSPSKRTPVDPSGERAKVFLAAVDGGNRIFFTSPEHLTDDANTGPARAGIDLYRYDVDEDTLVNVSAETNTANGSRVQGILGASDDGNWVYYVAQGEVLAGKGVVGQPNLYLWHDDGSADGETRFITTLGGSDGEVYAGSENSRRSRVSADGRVAIFSSKANLTGYLSGGRSQVFAFEADQNGGAGALSCISCDPSGAVPATDTVVGTHQGPIVGGDIHRTLSDDGKRAFFTTRAALHPSDVNGVDDVYEYQEGRVQLVSTGKSPQHSWLSGISADGDHVFLATASNLVGQDTDDMVDIYQARLGGGLAGQNPVPEGEPCQGDGCKPPVGATPASSLPGSAGVASEGNYKPAFEAEPLSLRQRSLLAARGRIGVPVKVEQPGRVQLRALQGRRVLGSGSKVVLNPTRTVVVLTLRPGAKRILNRQGHMQMQIEVSMAGQRQRFGLRLSRAGQEQGRSARDTNRRGK